MHDDSKKYRILFISKIKFKHNLNECILLCTHKLYNIHIIKTIGEQ